MLKWMYKVVKVLLVGLLLWSNRNNTKIWGLRNEFGSLCGVLLNVVSRDSTSGTSGEPTAGRVTELLVSWSCVGVQRPSSTAISSPPFLPPDEWWRWVQLSTAARCLTNFAAWEREEDGRWTQIPSLHLPPPLPLPHPSRGGCPLSIQKYRCIFFMELCNNRLSACHKEGIRVEKWWQL